MPSKSTLSEHALKTTSYGTINGNDSHSDIESGVGSSKPAVAPKYIDGEAQQEYNFVPGAVTDPSAPGYRYESRFFYDPHWTNTFDMFLIIFMAVWLLIMLTVSWFQHPQIFTNPRRFLPFWEQQIVKAIFMSFVAFCGGCIVTQLGVKVNYTRKIQHFCAYLIPLLTNEKKGATNEYADDIYDTVIMAWWGYWFTLMTFSVFVYPIRTRIRFVDIMFASLDRPEDRPETLKWMLSQIFIGYIIISAFTTYCQAAGLYEAKQLVFIPVIITGIGDGLAEPVGYRFGKHKYRTRGLCSPKLYTRSYEGSACVFLTGIVACLGCYHWFSSFLHFLLAIITIPITMTFAEAFSPHTWDTPFLMGTGFLLLWAITYVPENATI